MVNIYVGWDSREVDAYKVCCESIRRHTDNSLRYNILPLVRQELCDKNIYYRQNDPLAATEFTYTRFFIPLLQNYKGYAIFCDCDFLWLEGIDALMRDIDFNDEKAIYVCKHDYTPSQEIKMDNKQQTSYPRKNWSSLIIWNCDHYKNKLLTAEKVNKETGAFLHRFQWLDDSEIGDINIQWNWLVGEYNVTQHCTPRALHYTNGGPWFDDYKNCPYAPLWIKEYNRIKDTGNF
jgi:hypothetical protein